MVKGVIRLGEVGTRGATMIEIRCGRRDRHGHRSVAQLLAQYGPDVGVRHIMPMQIGECRNRDNTQVQKRRGPVFFVD